MRPDRRTRSDEGIVAVVRDRLMSALRTTTPAFPCSYAFLIHPRRREGEDGFGVITLQGESLPLSVAMLRALERTPSLIDGLSPAVLGPAEPTDIAAAAERGTSWNQVLPVHRIAFWPGHHAQGLGSARMTGSFLVAGHTGPQLVIFCAQRPEGWPA